jgi:hypothetical protein
MLESHQLTKEESIVSTSFGQNSLPSVIFGLFSSSNTWMLPLRVNDKLMQVVGLQSYYHVEEKHAVTPVPFGSMICEMSRANLAQNIFDQVFHTELIVMLNFN